MDTYCFPHAHKLPYTVPNSPYCVSLLSGNIPLILSQICDHFQCLGSLQIRRSTSNRSRSLTSLKAFLSNPGLSLPFLPLQCICHAVFLASSLISCAAVIDLSLVPLNPVQYGFSVTYQLFSLHPIWFSCHSSTVLLASALFLAENYVYTCASAFLAEMVWIFLRFIWKLWFSLKSIFSENKVQIR